MKTSIQYYYFSQKHSHKRYTEAHTHFHGMITQMDLNLQLKTNKAS